MPVIDHPPCDEHVTLGAAREGVSLLLYHNYHVLHVALQEVYPKCAVAFHPPWTASHCTFDVEFPPVGTRSGMSRPRTGGGAKGGHSDTPRTLHDGLVGGPLVPPPPSDPRCSLGSGISGGSGPGRNPPPLSPLSRRPPPSGPTSALHYWHAMIIVLAAL